METEILTNTIETSNHLRHFREVGQLNKWMLKAIWPYLRGRKMEMGSGSGGFSSLLVENGITVHLNDIENKYREVLRRKFSGVSLVRSMHKIDFHHNEFEKIYSNLFETIDTVLSLNIVDHNPIDSQAIINAKRLLRKNGNFIILTPIYTALYDEIDQDLEDLAKYNWSSITKLLGKDLTIIETNYINIDPTMATTILSHKGLSVIVVASK